MTAPANPAALRRAWSPGRVNLIGDHTDYNDGVALPMAIDLGVGVVFHPSGGRRIELTSGADPIACAIDIDIAFDEDVLRGLWPEWARLVAAVAALVRPSAGGAGTVRATVPVGAGLSSSAALEVALALVFGLEGDPTVVARLCQRAEQAATGVPSGIMDQLVVAAAVAGHALLIDFVDLSTTPVPVPDGVDVVVVHSGERRTLARTPYAARRAECEAAAFHLGPLGRVGPEAVMAIPDPLLRRRARHVITECDRVRWFAEALHRQDLVDAGRLMTASHRSLAGDFDVSTAAVDDLVARLAAVPGVYGARLTGAGFGGCVVALADAGAVDLERFGPQAWRVRPAAAARLVVPGDADP